MYGNSFSAMDWIYDPRIKDHPKLQEFKTEYEKLLALYLKVVGTRYTRELDKGKEDEQFRKLRRAEHGLASMLHHSIKQLFGSGMQAGLGCLASATYYVQVPEEALDNGPINDFLTAVSYYIDRERDRVTDIGS